jgi:hypothetical protein
LNWWTEFSTWQDFRALLRAGNRLSILIVVENLNRAKRKKMRRLKDVAGYNVAQYISWHSDVEDLEVSISLMKLVRPFVITISGDYIFDLIENRNKRIVKYHKNWQPFDPVVRLAIFKVDKDNISAFN